MLCLGNVYKIVFFVNIMVFLHFLTLFNCIPHDVLDSTHSDPLLDLKWRFNRLFKSAFNSFFYFLLTVVVAFVCEEYKLGGARQGGAARGDAMS